MQALVGGLADGDVIVSGDCPDSVDKGAAEAGRAHGLQVVEYLPDLKGVRNRGESARRYYARNQIVADDCVRMVAFVDPARKGGTEDTIKRAHRAGKAVDGLTAPMRRTLPIEPRP